MRLPVLLVLAGLLGVPLAARAQAPLTLTSPDGAVVVRLALDADGRATWAVEHGGAPILRPAPLALDVADAPAFEAGLRLREGARRSVDETARALWGKRTRIADRYNELTVRLTERRGLRRRVDVVFRAYDGGVAFRYVFPEAWGAFALAGERTRFAFSGSPTVWATNFGGFKSSQEAPFDRRALASLDPDSTYGLPMLVRVDSARWAAVTEADLTDWAGLHLARPADAPHALTTVLAPHPDEPAVAVRATAPRSSPWRAVLLADAPADLIGSDLVFLLNDPAEDDFSWVRPGIAAWDWWNGPWMPDADFEVGANDATMRRLVDFAAEMGWDYVLVDEGWYGPAFADPTEYVERLPHPTSRITTHVPALDVPALVAYAAERGVRIVLWLHWGHVRDQMQEAFPLYEDWGVAGVKIDFMDRDDQAMVRFYHDVAALAAEHRLLVDFHGAYKPTGVSRTYPNLVTREGVLGNEYNKWSALVTPEHNTTLPFTRGLLGEMDFTPGGFLNRTPEAFTPRNLAPFVMGTRAHTLAMFVVFESAFTVASDSPYSYRSAPDGLDFLQAVPTTWDETVPLGGYPGDYVAVARRSGDAWYVAAMTDEHARTLDLPLDALGGGPYEATLWLDAYEADAFPDRVRTATRTVTAGDTLRVELAPGGGFVARLVPSDAN